MVTSHVTIELLVTNVFHYNCDHVLTLHVAYNCNLRSRSRFHGTKIVRNHISHLIIGLLVENLFFFKISAGGHLGFLSFFCQMRHRIHVKFLESDI